jgi:hypothetical protein
MQAVSFIPIAAQTLLIQARRDQIPGLPNVMQKRISSCRSLLCKILYFYAAPNVPPFESRCRSTPISLVLLTSHFILQRWTSISLVMAQEMNCCVLSGTGLRADLLSRGLLPSMVCLCDLETSTMRRPRPELGLRAPRK